MAQLKSIDFDQQEVYCIAYFNKDTNIAASLSSYIKVLNVDNGSVI